ncbi:MAG TPA: uracil phosphoribosyltransferase [Acidimicrobiales bacterium]|nr:uracil phosphoribosyltransferase [Acidimicrobiales bacterium]
MTDVRSGPGRAATGDSPGDSPGGARILVIDHPLAAHRLSGLRQATTDSPTFRLLVAELSTFVAYEALRDLATVDRQVDTPVASGVWCRRVEETVLLVPVLRAGLGMVPAIQETLPATDVAHVGLRRDESTLLADVYLNRLPGDLTGRRVVVCDPMLATGGSLAQVCTMVKERQASSVSVLSLIASVPGLAFFRSVHPDVDVACVAVDPALDERGFIIPGLGDAGDRLFGPPD